MVRHGSPESPIKIEDSRQERYVPWEYEHIDRHVTLPRRCLQGLCEAGGRFLDRIVVRDAGFKHHVFYFDVTEPMAAGLKKIKDGLEDMKKNRDKLSPKDRQMLEAIEQDERKRGS